MAEGSACFHKLHDVELTRLDALVGRKPTCSNTDTQVAETNWGGP